jgi:hypothetical protein
VHRSEAALNEVKILKDSTTTTTTATATAPKQSPNENIENVIPQSTIQQVFFSS